MAVSPLIRCLRGAASLPLAMTIFAGAGAACAQVAAGPGYGVTAEALSAPDLWSNPGRATGLSTDLWRGTSAPLAFAVLKTVADRPISPAAAAMARRALATGAAAPDGAGSDPVLAALRARALIVLGDAEAAEAVLSRAARVDSSEPLSRVRAEAALLLGRDQVACDTGAALQDGRDRDFWVRLRIYCAIQAGQTPAAQVALDLWRQGGGKDAVFDQLAGAAAGGAPSKAYPAPLDELDYALLRRLGWGDDTPLDALAPSLISALAHEGGAPRSLSLGAVSRALRLGVLSPADAAAAYLRLADDSEPSGVASDPGEEARLTAIALKPGDPARREAAATAILKRARYPGEFPALAGLLAPALPEITRSGAPLGDPVLLASAAAVIGDTATADLVRGRIEQGAAPASSAHDLAILDALIAAGSGRSAGPVLDRLIDRGGAGDARARARSQGAARIFMALGQPASAQARADFATFDAAGPKASPERLQLMAGDAARGLKGETVLLALWIAEQQPAGPTTADRAALIAALRTVGLDDEARRLAIESLLVLQRL